MLLPLKVLELEFTILEFHSSYVISKLREGEVVATKQVQDLVEVCSDYYRGKPFVYISYRVNDYNVNPTIYLDLDKIKNLAGIGVVSKKASSLNMAQFEKNFCKLPYEIFSELKPARKWAEKITSEVK